MAVKSTGQLSLVEAFLPGMSRGSSRLDRILALVKWYRFEKLLKGLETSGPGRPGYPAVVMLRLLLLQSLYGLSDAETEEAVADRLSFRRFAGLGLEDAVPDHTTLCRFRNELVAATPTRASAGARAGKALVMATRRMSGWTRVRG